MRTSWGGRGRRVTRPGLTCIVGCGARGATLSTLVTPSHTLARLIAVLASVSQRFRERILAARTI